MSANAPTQDPWPPDDSWSGVEEIDLREYLGILLARRRMILLCVVIVAATALLFSLAQTPIYRASTTLEIEPDSPKILNFEDVFQVDATSDAFYQTQYRLIESRALAARVIDQEGLLQDPAVLGESGIASQTLGFVRGLPSRALGLVRGLFGTTLPADDDGPSSLDRARVNAIDGFLGSLSVSPIRGTRLVSVAWESPSPQQAAQVTRAVAQTYIDMNLEAKFATTQNAAQFLANEIESLGEAIAASEAQLGRYGAERNLLGEDERRDVTVQSLTELNRQYTSARNERVQRQSAYESLRNVAPSSIPEVRSNAVVQGLRADLAAQQQRFAELSRRFKEGYPEYDRARAQVEDLQQRIGDEEASVYQAILRQARADYQAAQSTEESFESLLAEQTRLVASQDQDLIRYRSLQAQVRTQRDTLASLLERQSETGVSARLQGLQTSNIRIVDAPTVPLGPIRPDVRTNLLLGIVLGLMLGVGVAFAQAFLDTTLKSPEDLERRSGLPTMAVIPALSSVAATGGGYGFAYAYGHRDYTEDSSDLGPLETVTHAHPRSSVAEAFRALRTSVLLSRAGEPPQVVVITSSEPGEGKSSIAANLAVTMAQTGRKTLLLDADLRKPRVHTIFGLPVDTGLVTLLTGADKLDDIVRETAVENLWAVPAGPRPPNPAELLGAEVVKDLVTLLRGHFDTIIVDTPPVSAVVDPLEMSVIADGVLVVVSSGTIPRALLERTVRRLRAVNAPILGTVLNRFDLASDAYGQQRYSYHAPDATGAEAPRRRRARAPVAALAWLGLAALLPAPIVAQEERPSVVAGSGPGADYNIGARDLLEIRVFEAADMDAVLRVTEDGLISMPLIGDILVAGLSRADVETAIEAALRRYMTDPQVNVFIREFRSQRVAVIGAVTRPGTVEMQGRMTLLEAIAESGGIDYVDAQGTIAILRAGIAGAPVEIDIDELINRGNMAFNIELRAGDTVNVVSKPNYTVYVYGRVRNPGQFTVREPITLLQAIAMAGGLADRARSKVFIQRKGLDGGVEKIEVDVNDIMDGKVDDIPVLPDDVIVVPETFF